MIRIELESVSPLNVADGHTSGSLSKTRPYIPGRAIRGMLAEAYLTQRPVDAQFESHFLAEGSWFGCLYPTGRIAGGETFVLPATAATCKMYGGFRQEEGERHGVRDMLWEWMKPEGVAINDVCSETGCGAPLVPYSGFYRHGQRMARIEPRRRLITRTALDSRRETAAQAQLFTLEVTEEAEHFVGWIELADAAQETAFVQSLLGAGSELRIGRARTRGLGRMRVVSADTRPGQRSTLWPRTSLLEQIVAFDAGARGAGVEVESGKTLFSLTFLSDGVVRDRYLRNTTDVTASLLGRYVDSRLETAVPLRAIVHSKLLEGWQAMHGLPRDTALAIEAGSVYTFASDLSAADLAHALQHVERTGFGEWRSEGYGRVMIGHPFHFQGGVM